MQMRHLIHVVALLLGSVSLASGLELKDITFPTADAGKVIFSHNIHMQQLNKNKKGNFSCKSCHNQQMQKNAHYSMADMAKGKSCGMCHNGKKAFALEQCTKCHKVKDVKYQVKATGPVLFSHNRHLKKSQCSACHNALFKAGPGNKHGVTMGEMEKGKSCGACHNGKQAFALADCSKCHPVKEITYKLEGIGEGKFSHTFHTGMYKCGECHPGTYLPGPGNKRGVSMGDMEKGKSCGICHDGKSAFSVKESCDKCHKM